MRWAGIAGGIIAFVALCIGYLMLSGGGGRADACLGTTDPIERGVMLNKCDHPISVLACPRTSSDGECSEHDVQAGEAFEVQADVPVVAHACRAPHRAVLAGDGTQRDCAAAE
jgi:hypothetical protein